MTVNRIGVPGSIGFHYLITPDAPETKPKFAPCPQPNVKPGPTAPGPAPTQVPNVVASAPTPPSLQINFDTIGQTQYRTVGSVRTPMKLIWVEGVTTSGQRITGDTVTFAASLCAPLDQGELGECSVYLGDSLIFSPSGGVVIPGTITDPLVATRLTAALIGMLIYPGTEGQIPDPRILADRGVKYTPAFRGTRYVVMPEWPTALPFNNLTFVYERTSPGLQGQPGTSTPLCRISTLTFVDSIILTGDVSCFTQFSPAPGNDPALWQRLGPHGFHGSGAITCGISGQTADGEWRFIMAGASAFNGFASPDSGAPPLIFPDGTKPGIGATLHAETATEVGTDYKVCTFYPDLTFAVQYQISDPTKYQPIFMDVRKISYDPARHIFYCVVQCDMANVTSPLAPGVVNGPGPTFDTSIPIYNSYLYESRDGYSWQLYAGSFDPSTVAFPEFFETSGFYYMGNTDSPNFTERQGSYAPSKSGGVLKVEPIDDYTMFGGYQALKITHSLTGEVTYVNPFANVRTLRPDGLPIIKQVNYANGLIFVAGGAGNGNDTTIACSYDDGATWTPVVDIITVTDSTPGPTGVFGLLVTVMLTKNNYKFPA